MQLKKYGVGQPTGDLNLSYTFSKSSEGDVVIRVKIEQKPERFLPGDSSIESLELDTEKSLVTFDYNLTCHFNNDGKLSITSGPIDYTCQLAESTSQETLTKF
jgi:hypothetical protein